MKNLYERLKPEIKESLVVSGEKYSSSVQRIFNKLKDEKFYDDLTIGDVSAIHTYADISITKVSVWDMKFGEHLFFPFSYE